jgi:hypothetical protein
MPSRDQYQIVQIQGVSAVDDLTNTSMWVDPTTHRLYVDALISAGDIEIGAVEIKNSGDDTRATVGALGLYVDPRPLTAVFNGTKTVPTGTAEAISSTQAIHSVTIKALSTNTVAIYVGTTGVTTANGFELLAGESVSLDCDNLTDVYCISGSASQVIRWVAV